MAVKVVKPLDPRTALTAIDTEAYETMKRAGQLVQPIIDADTPRVSGRVAAALKPRVRRTATGAGLRIGATRGRRHGNVTAAQVVRFVTQGTGVYGYSHKPIRPKGRKALFLREFGKDVRSVRGQRPNPFLDRIKQTADLKVQAEQQRGAERAARAAERAF